MLTKNTRVRISTVEHETINKDCAAAISGKTGVVEDERIRAYDSLKDSFVLVRFDTPVRHWSDPSPNIFVDSFWVPRRFVCEYDPGKWQRVSFLSGTVIVQRCDGVSSPWLYVYYAADLEKHGITEDESERKRSEYAEDLAVFLSGGPRPQWMDTYRREGATFVKNDLAGTISAVGPMILPPNDNGRLSWVQDESEQAKSDRIALVDRLGCPPNHSGQARA